MTRLAEVRDDAQPFLQADVPTARRLSQTLERMGRQIAIAMEHEDEETFLAFIRASVNIEVPVEFHLPVGRTHAALDC